MLKTRKDENPATLQERVNNFIGRHWKAGLVLIVATIVAMSGFFLVDIFSKGKAEESNVLADDIYREFSQWMSEDSDKRNDEIIVPLIDKALKDYPNQFAAQRALFSRARMSAEKEEWKKAASDFETIVGKWPQSYLSPISLFSAASAYEEAGENDAAKTAWTRLVDEYTSTSGHIPEALFNLGRMAETEGGLEDAVAQYEKIVSLYPESFWTNLAKDRIIVLRERL